MVEKRQAGATQRKINLKEGDDEVENAQVDEIDLLAPNEETKGDVSDEKPKNNEAERLSKFPMERPLRTREAVQAYSRWLHHNTPLNRYFKVKIPWKTILIAFVFLIVGTALLYFGICEMMNVGLYETEPWEKVLLGAILFIPGSFHSFLAVQALRGVQGYDYEHLTVFENEKFFEED